MKFVSEPYMRHKSRTVQPDESGVLSRALDWLTGCKPLVAPFTRAPQIKVQAMRRLYGTPQFSSGSLRV